MPVLVQKNAEKQGHDKPRRDERPEQGPSILKAEEGEEYQEQKKGPMNLSVYAKSPAYLERTTHAPQVYPVVGDLM